MRHPNRKKKVKNSWIKRYKEVDTYLYISDDIPKYYILYTEVKGKIYANMTKLTYKKLVKEAKCYIVWRKDNA
jgi:hypothetical protein